MAAGDQDRWHHTFESEGLDKNFAGLFAFYDLLFGTFYMPEARQPEKFGVESERIPAGIWGQLLYPFRRPLRTASFGELESVPARK